MFVLVDYDNIQAQIREKGVFDVVDILFNSIASAVLVKERRLVFRLYGGWYEGDSLSPRAQKITSELQNQFPRVIIDNSGSGYFVNVELAYSLACDPERHLFYTYRRKSAPRGLRVSGPNSCIKGNSDCCIRGLNKFIEKGKCPEQGCEESVQNRLWRSEQKMVDTMLSADLITFCAREEGHQVCVVTSDDDLWPPLRTSLMFSENVYHLQAMLGVNIPDHYSSGVNGLVSIELKV